MLQRLLEGTVQQWPLLELKCRKAPTMSYSLFIYSIPSFLRLNLYVLWLPRN